MISRRQALKSSLFGAGALGLRALATGLPPALLLDPRRALADDRSSCTAADKAQFFVFQTSGNGDPINASVPGTYEDPGISHSTDPAMAPARLTLRGQATTAATPWTKLSQGLLDRTTFWHLMTTTPVHPKEPQVLSLMGASRGGEMLPSLLAKHLAPCLGTIQAQPISLGATSPSEGLTYEGQALPIIPALSLKATLTNQAGRMAALQPLRDKTLDRLYGVYKNTATSAQRQYIDSLVTSQSQVRNIRQDLLERLAAITDNSVTSQIQAAVVLILMKVTPVVAIHIPFGGDNHRDIGLARESADTVAGVAAIGSLMDQLAAAGVGDQTSFVSLNVFGRTLGARNVDGRSHNSNHQASLMIGKPFRGGVIGGITPMAGDYGALPIDSKTGKGSPGGDIQGASTLASFGKTLLSAIGVPPDVAAQEIIDGQAIVPALA